MMKKKTWIREFIEKYLWIRDKEPKLNLLKLNTTQNLVMDIIETLWEYNKPVRIIILKARQQGISTLIQAILFVITIHTKLMYAKTVSYDVDSATALYEMAERYYRKLPKQLQPPTKYYTKKSLVFRDMENDDEDLDSRITIDSAKKIESGRSLTLQLLHISEMGMMEDIAKLLASLRNSVPKNPLSFVAVESTAQGAGNDFHDQWLKASTLDEVLSGEVKEGHTNYVKIFIPWYIHDEYKITVPKKFKLYKHDHEIYGNEKQEMETYGLTLEQMAWRRDTIVNECDGDIEIFRQEYPANEDEAFISSGRLRFDKSAIHFYRENVKNPDKTGELFTVETLEEAEKHYGGDAPDIEFQEDPNGKLLIYEMPKISKIRPENNCFYAIGCDVSEGLLVEGNRKPDPSAISVWKRVPYEKVASWRGWIEPDDLAWILYQLGYFYNYAWIGVEKNNHGYTTNKILQDIYPFLFYKTVIDEKTEKETKKFGWETNRATKPYMIDQLARLFRQKAAKIPDKQTIDEYSWYTIYNNGKTRAPYGKTDDIIMADAIALQVHTLMPYPDLELSEDLGINFAYR
jgi:hypothetical protein